MLTSVEAVPLFYSWLSLPSSWLVVAMAGCRCVASLLATCLRLSDALRLGLRFVEGHGMKSGSILQT